MFKTIIYPPSHEIAKFKGKAWLKVFSHTYESKNDCFSNEAKHNIDDRKFSILDEINDSMKINGKYEFIIEYPKYNEYFQWLQSSNPLEEIEVDGKMSADGFQYIHNGSYADKWGGLVKTTLKYNGVISTLLDGEPGHYYWMFSIGAYCIIQGWDMTTGFPGSNRGAHKVNIWIRLKQNSSFFTCKAVYRTYSFKTLLAIVLFS